MRRGGMGRVRRGGERREGVGEEVRRSEVREWGG